jgi:ADP-heptose:LPS heptosyltransferase
MLVANVGTMAEVVYDSGMQPMTLARGDALPEEMARRLRGVPATIQPVGSVVDLLQKQPAAGVRLVRFGGLGDVCMLLPVVRALQATFPTAQFTIETNYDDLFAADPTLRRRPMPASRRILLDDWLELDHTGDPVYSHVPRIDLYGRALGIALEPPVSWDLQLDEDDERVAAELVQTSARTTIAVQLKGHAPHRSLGPQLIGPLVDALRPLGRLVLLDDDRTFGPTGDGIVNLAGKTTPRQAIAVLKRCDAALTMESGVFWLAHIAKVPTVCLFGPTRPSERITHHPRYPHGVKAVVMNDLLTPHCPPCWGNGSHCEAWQRKKARCMDEPDPSTVAGLVLDAIESVRR